MLTAEMQMGGLLALDFARNIFRGCPQGLFTREEIVGLLEKIQRDCALFTPEVQARHAAAPWADATGNGQVN